MFEQHDKYRKDNDIDSFFGANLDEITRKELLDRIKEFMTVPQWWTGVTDEHRVRKAKPTNVED